MYIDALVASGGVALVSVIGVFFFGGNSLSRLTSFILPVAVGTFLSVVFFELIPEAIEISEVWGSVGVATGFLFFYLLSHLIRTYHHHHDEECHEEDTRSGALLMLLGDAVHNISDGIVIGAAFLISPITGIVATIGIVLHEVPQEIAEFGVLLHAGYTKTQAAIYNFLSATSIVIGTAMAILFSSYITDALGILLGIAAGNLLYIAASDILPGLRQDHHTRGTFWKSFTATVAGMAVMAAILLSSH